VPLGHSLGHEDLRHKYTTFSLTAYSDMLTFTLEIPQNVPMEI